MQLEWNIVLKVAFIYETLSAKGDRSLFDLDSSRKQA